MPDSPPTSVLLRPAQREIADDGPSPALQALHRRATREVFDAAAALVTDEDADRHALGVLILRDLDLSPVVVGTNGLAESLVTSWQAGWCSMW